jgi:iron complex transport system ATP-binding protein
MSAPLLEARGLAAGYGGRAVVHDVSLQVAPGELVGLLGRNGAGKTTLLRVLAGLRRPLAGTVHLQGDDLHALARRTAAQRVAVVTQEREAILPFRVGEVVLMGRVSRLPALGFDGPADRAAAERAMATAGVAELADRYPDQLSGGEWQRVRVARALAQEPALLLLDEPTAHLDLHHRWRLYDVLARLRAERGCGVLVVSHDLHPLLDRADRVVLLSDGQVAASGPPATVATPERLAAAFDVPLDGVPRGATTPPRLPTPDSGREE